MTEIKNILLSAYACEPNKGSEPGVGWSWAIELANQGYSVSVLTRANNKEVIENELKNNNKISNLKFYYYDLPNWIKRIKKLPFGIYIYYLFWQLGIVNTAKKICNNNKINLIHHITFGVFRQVSFLWLTNKRFVFGPVGGAEMTPHKLLRSLNFIDYIKEIARIIVNNVYKYSPLLNYMFYKTDLILCKTKDTYKFIPKCFDEKKQVQIEIGINEIYDSEVFVKKNTLLKILYVGRFIGWKGVSLAVDAVNYANESNDEVEFTLIGKGKLKSFLKQKSKKNIKFIDWVSQEELFKLYSSYDCMLFPSFHDSSGNVILESFSFGLPVICLDLGGPASIVDNSCGYAIDTHGKTSKEISIEISKVLIDLKMNNKKLHNLKKGALKKALLYSWTSVVEKTYAKIYESIK